MKLHFFGLEGYGHSMTKPAFPLLLNEVYRITKNIKNFNKVVKHKKKEISYFKVKFFINLIESGYFFTKDAQFHL